MRIVLDVMGAPKGSGGMNLYAREFIQAWSENFEYDSILVVGGDWAREAFTGSRNVRVRVVRGNSVAARLWAQTVIVAIEYWKHGVDTVLSVSPITTPFVPRLARNVVVHDWRHINHPSEFSLVQRLYRRLWVYSINRAEKVFVISDKTRRETLQVSRPRDVAVVRNGGDHARRWAPPTSSNGSRPAIITFGHLPHKRPELVIGAIPDLIASGLDVELIVLGAKGEYRDALFALSAELGVGDRVAFPGFVTDVVYQSMIQASAAVVLASTDEGFGLPIVEANYFGIPALVTSDSGLSELHPGRVTVVHPDSKSLAEGIRRAFSTPPLKATTNLPTWFDCVRRVREGVTQTL